MDATGLSCTAVNAQSYTVAAPWCVAALAYTYFEPHYGTQCPQRFKVLALRNQFDHYHFVSAHIHQTHRSFVKSNWTSQESDRKHFFINKNVLCILVNDNLGFVKTDSFLAFLPGKKLPALKIMYLKDCGYDSSSVFSQIMFRSSSTICASSLCSVEPYSGSG